MISKENKLAEFLTDRRFRDVSDVTMIAGVVFSPNVVTFEYYVRGEDGGFFFDYDREQVATHRKSFYIRNEV